ncbi:MAG: hypothetical protein WA405_05725 [Candidatus Acidiferrales bacterium]
MGAIVWEKAKSTSSETRVVFTFPKSRQQREIVIALLIGFFMSPSRLTPYGRDLILITAHQ